MDWCQIFLHCMIWVVGVVVVCVGLWLVVMIPIMLITAFVGLIYGSIPLFLPFLPPFWATLASSSNDNKKKGFDWGDKTEADRHRDLVEHIRIQQMNEDLHRR
ncbi:hypothetical protein QGZ99_02070 [Kingella kingae]|uniref:hypothetical protein n=1 Tax=Kingella kingae TaxID=504 RepID=UPI000428C750|nr:hypothetical protein [Kingella kingae]MDK4533885.1 hypothetical protein [Kingella kingae]MDK4540458.1 hypothetical protein [Kingella kingae]MDK4552908.1 hypothetical protein [Kingella kingae]